MPWNAMHYFVWTFDGTAAKLYVDGVAKTVTTAGADSGYARPDGGLTLGKTYAAESGILDEARISDVVRSADWIATEYNNQGTPGTFYSMGAQQASGGGGGSVSVTVTSSPAGQSLTVSVRPTQVSL